MGLIWIR